MSATGMGSLLIYRAKEAMMRAKATQMLGLTQPEQSTMGMQVQSPMRPSPGTQAPIDNGNQPYQAPSLTVPQSKMLGDIDQFFTGIQQRQAQLTQQQQQGTGV